MFAPKALLTIVARPAVETAGYFHRSLRDESIGNSTGSAASCHAQPKRLGSSLYMKNVETAPLLLENKSRSMMRRKMAILIVDDDANDQFLIQTALRRGGAAEPIFAVNDGAEAIAYLRGEGQYSDRDFFKFPTFILTDLKMPRVNGFELLRFMRQNPSLAVLPTIVLSSSADQNDVHSAYLLGANSYQVKSQSLDALCGQMKLIHDYWMHCEVPEADASGNLPPTEGRGKLSERVLLSSRRKL